MIDKIKYGIFPNPKPDEEGNTTYQVRHTPEANDVEVQGVSFTPDPSFVKELKENTSTRNKYGRGAAGRNQPYTREQIVTFLDEYLREHHSITRRQMERALNITPYRAQKWLDDLTAEEFSKYYAKKQGNTYVYYRYGWEG